MSMADLYSYYVVTYTKLLPCSTINYTYIPKKNSQNGKLLTDDVLSKGIGCWLYQSILNKGISVTLAKLPVGPSLVW